MNHKYVLNMIDNVYLLYIAPLCEFCREAEEFMVTCSLLFVIKLLCRCGSLPWATALNLGHSSGLDQMYRLKDNIQIYIKSIMGKYAFIFNYWSMITYFCVISRTYTKQQKETPLSLHSILINQCGHQGIKHSWYM